MATFPTGTIYFKKSYFVVHYLTIIWANNSGCMVRGMQHWLLRLRLWNHEFRSRLVYAWPHLSVCIVMWRYTSCDELLPYPRSPTKCLTDSYFLELILKWDKPEGPIHKMLINVNKKNSGFGDIHWHDSEKQFPLQKRIFRPSSHEVTF
jgi:hypothetical protein